jgi:tetratricopeptide (TPR) repeat protein
LRRITNRFCSLSYQNISYQNLPQYEEAERWFQAIFAISPKDNDAQTLLGTLTACLYLLIFSLNLTRTLSFQGNLYLISEDWKKAQPCFEQMINANNQVGFFLFVFTFRLIIAKDSYANIALGYIFYRASLTTVEKKERYFALSVKFYKQVR